MLRLWSEHLCISLLPDRVSWVILRRGGGKRVREHGSVPVLATDEGNFWQTSLDALQRALPDIPISGGAVTVVLSNAWVRYLVVNSMTLLTNDEERRALANYDLRKIYGDLLDGWEVQISAGEQNYLAAAMDRELLVALRQCFASGRFKLRSIQPYVVLAFNHWLKQFSGKTAQGLLLAEPYGYCYAGVSEGRWEFIYTGRWEGDPLASCQRVIQREASRSGNEAREVWFASSNEMLMDAAFAKQLPLNPCFSDAQKDDYFMALLGAA